MGGLTAADMTELQALDELFMPTTCTIVHPGTPTQDADGGWTDGTDTTTPDVPLRFLSGVQAERVLGARLTEEADAVAFVPLGTSVDRNDRLTVGSETYEIIGDNENQSFRTSIALTLRLVK